MERVCFNRTVTFVLLLARHLSGLNTEDGFFSSFYDRCSSLKEDTIQDFILPLDRTARLQRKICDYTYSILQGNVTNFTDDFQRHIVTTQLWKCPFVDLCKYGHYLPQELLPIFYEKSCCESCSCDIPRCLQYGSCCPDVINNNLTFLQYPRCTTLTTEPSWSLQKYYGVYAISDCSSNDRELQKNCSQKYQDNLRSFYDILPCTSRLTSNVYRNKYCALCNGEQEQDLVFFQAQVAGGKDWSFATLTESEVMKKALAEKDMLIDFVPSDSQTVARCKVLIDTCNVTGKWAKYDNLTERACRSYTSEIDGYKNIFCMMCNGGSLNEFLCPTYRFLDYRSYSFSGMWKLESMAGLNKDQLSTGNEHEDEHCSSSQLYDVISVCNFVSEYHVTLFLLLSSDLDIVFFFFRLLYFFLVLL